MAAETTANASWLHTPTPLARVGRPSSASRSQLVRSEGPHEPRAPLAPSATSSALVRDRKPDVPSSQPDRQLTSRSGSGPIANPFKPPPPPPPSNAVGQPQSSNAVGQPQASTSAVAPPPSTPASKLDGSGLASKPRPSAGVPSVSAASAHAAGRALAAKRLRMSVRCGFCYALVRFSRLNRCVLGISCALVARRRLEPGPALASA